MQQSSEMQKLICDIQNGVPLSFETVYSLYGPLINSLAEKYGGSSLSGAELEDLRQEAAIALYDAALAFNPERGVSFGLYAKICIKNRIISSMIFFFSAEFRSCRSIFSIFLTKDACAFF